MAPKDEATLQQVWAKGKGYPWWPAVVLPNGLGSVERPQTHRALERTLLRHPEAQCRDLLLFYATREYQWRFRCRTVPFDPSQAGPYWQQMVNEGDSEQMMRLWTKAVQVCWRSAWNGKGVPSVITGLPC